MKIINSINGYPIQVSDIDYDHLNQDGWHVSKKTRHVYRCKRINGKRVTILMANVILDLMKIENPKGGDHIDQKPQNNQRENLRPATRSQNGANRGPQKNNTSGYKGVCWHKKAGKWKAAIGHDGKTKHLGYFENAEDAARAFDCAALELFKDFSWLNFPGNYVLFD